MKKFFIILIITIIVIITIALGVISVKASVTYKSYQERTLISTLKINTELTDKEINHLASLPPLPEFQEYEEPVIGTTNNVKMVRVVGEWLYQEGETIIHFNGCEGLVIVSK